MAAAVADFRPRDPLTKEKITRHSTGLTLELEPTPDLLEGSRARIPHGIRVGWALSLTTAFGNQGGENSTRNLHAIVANPLETISDERITPILLHDDGREDTPPGGAQPKEEFARWLLDRLEPRLPGTA